MSTKFLSPSWRMPRNANQSKSSNYSLDFDGSDVIEVPLTIDGLSSVTMSVWFKNTNDTQTNQYLLSFPRTATNNGFDINLNLQEVRSALSGSSGNFNMISSTLAYTDGNWHHVAVSYDGTSHKMYIDGVLTALDSVSYGTINNTTGMFYIGAFNVSGSSPVSGIDSTELNQVAVFDYTLSDGGISVGDTATGEIAQLYGNGSSLSNPMALSIPPKAYYPLGESAGGFVGGTGTWLTENNAIGDYVFDFDGSSSTISIGDLSSVEGNDFTISIWLNRDYAHSSVIYNSGSAHPNGLIFQSNQNGSFFISVGGGFGTTSIMTISDRVWYNAILTVSGTTAKVYVNGSQLGSSLTVGSSRTGIGSGAVIGEYNHGIGFNFNGKLSNAQVFNTELSGPEVETIYNNGSPIRTLANIPQNSNLKAWYKLDATEVYNSTSTEWEVNNSSNPSIYNNFINFNNKWMKVYPIGSGNNGEGGLILPDTYTISLWAKMNSDTAGFFEGTLHTGGFHPGWGNPFRYSAIVNGKWRLYNAGSVIYVTSDITDGKWHHILLTYSSSTTTLTVYTDNIQTFTSSSRNYGTENNIGRIGSGSDGSSNFTGNISNISIWDGVVTTSQRGELYNNGAPKDLINNSNYSNLKHWYIFNSQETGARTLIDQKGSNNLLAYSQHTPTFGFINTLAGESTGMSQTNLVQSDLQTVAPYSKYALSFDGNDYIDCGNDSVFQFQAADSFSVSAWLNINSVTGNADFIVSNGLWNTSPYSGWGLNLQGANILRFDLTDNNLANQLSIDSSGITLNTNTWYHVLFTYDGSNSTTGMNFYLDGSLTSKTIVANNALGTITYTSSMKLNIGARESGVRPFNGDISNVSIFDSALTQAQVTEIYNQGLPSNLHNFSGTAPVAWWQLGENSSFNGNDWICADEIGSNNGESDGMGVDALTNGVGTTANGSSTGMSEGSLVGNAPYSVASTVSRNVAVQEFDPLAPSTVISGRSEDVPS